MRLKCQTGDRGGQTRRSALAGDVPETRSAGGACPPGRMRLPCAVFGLVVDSLGTGGTGAWKWLADGVFTVGRGRGSANKRTR